MAYLYMFLVISALIAVHELGHMLGAKLVRIPVSRFSLGFGPKVWGFKTYETEYRLSAIPIGGYVLAEALEEPEHLRFPFLGRIVFALSGPLANIFLALVLLSAMSVAASGLSFSSAVMAPLAGVWHIIIKMIKAVAGLFERPDQVSGIVGIVALGGQYAGTSIARILEISVLLNVNLAIFNLLPLPPLDGGRIVMCILERIYKPVVRFEIPFALAGWALLISLMMYTTILDIARLAKCSIS